MTEFLTVFCAKMFIFWFNLLGRLDPDLAFGLLNSMNETVVWMREKDKIQENYLNAVKGKAK
jgi:hypothetical protein